jgi:hypothetical protein
MTALRWLHARRDKVAVVVAVVGAMIVLEWFA